jgi:hypothetical protein
VNFRELLEIMVDADLDVVRREIANDATARRGR